MRSDTAPTSDDDDWLREQQKALGGRLFRLREQRGLSQQALGEQIGRDRRFIGRIERAETTASSDDLFRIARALRVEVLALFWG
ncbi:helix-turn-helix domain-containing protein [Kitasatospora sp. NPDC004289]